MAILSFTFEGCPDATYNAGDFFPFMSWFFGGPRPYDSLDLARFEKFRCMLLVLGFDPLEQYTIRALPMLFDEICMCLPYTDNHCFSMSSMFALARLCKERVV